MKISEAWLRSWVDPKDDIDRLAERLTMSGTKVEEVVAVAQPFSGVVVADVVDVGRHPDAAKLSVCRVFDGEGDRQVVCGAPNVRPGMKAAFARVGAVLPDGTVIGKAKLRGVESSGMLCSARELGLGDDAGGLMALSADLASGTDLRRALRLDDRVVEFDLTPNRGDCMSVRGIAREVGVLCGMPVSAPECTPVAAAIADTLPVHLDDPVGCPRYLGRIIRDVDVSRATPAWMVERLERSGLRSIDAVVDVTNYVMLELGQPSHAFDLALLNERIVVRRAQADETLTLLDGTAVKLDQGTLLIADAAGPVAIAGVMGGARSGISPTTRDVFLEVAFFAPLALAGTARRHGLQTDASQRFERGVDPALQFAAMERATALLLEIVGGRAGPVVDSSSASHLPAAREIELRRARLDRFVGVEHDDVEVEGILQRLGFEIAAADRNGWRVRVPSHRFDVEREVDLIEEVCRIRGYDRVPVGRPQAAVALDRAPLDATPRQRLRALLVDLGYQELVTYSFVDPPMQDLFDPGARAIVIENPMSAEHSVMRTTLLPGLVKALLGNLARQQARVRIFEIGRCFVTTDAGLDQRARVGGLVYGDRWPEAWSNAAAPTDFFDVKGDVERLLALGGVGEPRFEALEDPVLHPGQAARIVVDGEAIGRIGRLHPEIEQRLELRRAAFVFELDAQASLRRATRRYREASRFPSVRRDLSLLLAREVSAGALEQCVRRVCGPTLVDFTLFDVYEGEGIDSAKKSVAVGLTFQDPARTLTDSEVNALMDAAIGALDRDLGARLRS
jgi:phenylalanyl-tRNA synthetase beta chain